MNVLNTLKTLDKDTKAEVYLAGKYIRNGIRKKKHTAQIEAVVRNFSFSMLLKWLRKHGKVKFVSTLAKKNNTIIFTTNGDSREILLRYPKKGNTYGPSFSIKDDAKTKDFVLDSMYLPIREGLSKPNIIDYFGALKDIQNKKIRIIGKPQILLKKNPSLMLKAIALSTELNYKIDSNLFYGIKANAINIKKVDVDYIRSILIQIILSNKPSKQFKVMHDIGILSFILPELDLCYGVTQNKKYHKHDVFTHCVLSCDNATLDLTIRMAALLHDIGKVQTREEKRKGKEIKITFYSHEVVSTKLAKKALKRLKFENTFIKTVCDYIYLHMYNYEPKQWTDTAVKRFITKAGITSAHIDDLSNFPLFLVRRAERLSYGNSNVHAVSIRQQQFELRIQEIFSKMSTDSINILDINGDDIMKEFNLKPGPTVGNILNYLVTVVKEDRSTNEKGKLVTIAGEYLSEALK